MKKMVDGTGGVSNVEGIFSLTGVLPCTKSEESPCNENGRYVMTDKAIMNHVVRYFCL